MKSIFQSKVFWLAVGQALVGVIAVFASAYPALGFLVVAKSVLDIVLRLYTTQAIS